MVSWPQHGQKIVQARNRAKQSRRGSHLNYRSVYPLPSTTSIQKELVENENKWKWGNNFSAAISSTTAPTALAAVDMRPFRFWPLT